MQDEFVIYVLYSFEHDKIYIGYTSHLMNRLYFHNNGHKGHTRRYRPWSVVHVEFFQSKTDAKNREKMLKGSRGQDWIKSNLDRDAGFISVSD